LQKLWQESLEWTYYESILPALEQAGRRPPQAPTRPFAQLFFCIDDRACSLRRYLEAHDPRLETWGVPGFFGVDWLFQGVGSGFAAKLCPAPLRPKHLVRETPREDRRFKRPRLLQLLHLAPSNTLFRGWL